MKMLLPSVKWLQKNGYSGLDAAMKRSPHLFAHIPQEKLLRKPEEWVPIAEKLAKKSGKLPNSKWLRKNGYIGLSQAIRKYPHLFAHIPQEKLRTTPEEWVPIAEKLAKKSGKLPNSAWLQKNGYRGLDFAIRKHPHLFAHIPQEKLHITAEEWIPIAEKLAKKSEKLPNSWWLQKNGYSGLYHAMTRSPHLFAHIPQEKLLRTPEEWVPIAEKLAKKSGKLPNCGWLQKNGYSGLDAAMRNHPHLFAHLQQVRLKTNGEAA